MINGLAADVDGPAKGPEDKTAAALITAILLEHFGDGLPVHADVVMDTVQYRLARDETMAARARRDGCYCVWADRRASRAYRWCLARLVRSGRIRVVYDCGCGCGACLEDGGGNGCTGRATQRPTKSAATLWNRGRRRRRAFAATSIPLITK